MYFAKNVQENTSSQKQGAARPPQGPAASSPKSDGSSFDVTGLILVIVIFLVIVLTLILTANGGRFPLLVQPAPSNPTLQARVYELETQVAQLLQENPAAVLETPTRPPLPTLVVTVGAANVRAGPGVQNESLGVVEKGQTLRGPYRTQSGWLQVCCVDNGKRGWISGELVTEQNRSSTVPDPTRTPKRTVSPTPTRTPASPTITPTKLPIIVTIPRPGKITSPPPSVGANPMYTKYLNAGGAHILATVDVSNGSMNQAHDILLGMMSTRPDLLTAMTRVRSKIVIFDHDKTPLHTLPEFKNWPLAPLKAGAFAYKGGSYIVAAPEYRLNCSPILVHEIAHAIDYALQHHEPWFSPARDLAYQNAMEAGFWTREYAATNKHEYFAVAVERHFRLQKGLTTLAKKDPEAKALVDRVFGEAQIPRCR